MTTARCLFGERYSVGALTLGEMLLVGSARRSRRTDFVEVLLFGIARRSRRTESIFLGWRRTLVVLVSELLSVNQPRLCCSICMRVKALECLFFAVD